jgi:RNA polymerase sigma-70 factor, ECF subfamily
VAGDESSRFRRAALEARVADQNASATAMVQRLRLVFGGREAPPPAETTWTFEVGEAGVAPRRVGYLSDSDLTALVAAGSDQTLGELDHRYGRIAHELALGILREPGVAEHVVEAAIYAVWREGRPGATALQVAAAILARVHRKSVDSALAPDGSSSAPFPPDEAPARSGAWDLEHEPVHRALVQLPDEERELVVLAYYAGLRASELTNGLGMHDGTTSRRIQVGLRRLGAALAGARERPVSDASVSHSPA